MESVEWRNQRKTLDYPLLPNDIVPKDLILDAVFYLDPDVILKKIVNKELFIEFHCECPQGNIIWRRTKSTPENYLFNDFGKILISDEAALEFGTNPIGFELVVDVVFIQTLCYPVVNLTLMGLSGDVTLKRGDRSNITKEENSLIIDLEESECLEFDCVRSINGQAIVSKNLVIAGDPCTSITTFPGQVAINDECLPPCFDCDDRLTVGDVHQTMLDLENRVTALEP